MSTPLRYTTSDLECLPAIDGVRYEIIDGDLYVSRTPDWHHQYVSSQVWRGLQDWNDQSGAGLAIEASGIIFAPDENVVPDVVWISQARLRHIFDAGGHLRAAPDLAVEVLSPGADNERRDRELKLKLYSRQGVREYWIVDWQLQTMQAYRRAQAALELVATLTDGDMLTSPLLPGFACPLSKLWPPMI